MITLLIMYGTLAFSDPHFSRIESFPNDPGRYQLSWSLPDSGHKTVATVWLTDGRQRGVWLQNEYYGDCDTRAQAFRLVPTPAGYSYEVTLESFDGGLNQVAFTGRDHFGPIIYEEPPDTGEGPAPNPIVTVSTDGLTVSAKLHNHAQLGEVWLEHDAQVVRFSDGVASIAFPAPGGYSVLVTGDFGSVEIPVSVNASLGQSWLRWVSDANDFYTGVYIATSEVQRRLSLTLFLRNGLAISTVLDVPSHNRWLDRWYYLEVSDIFPGMSGSLYMSDADHPYMPIEAQALIGSPASPHWAWTQGKGDHGPTLMPGVTDAVYVSVANTSNHDTQVTIRVNGTPVDGLILRAETGQLVEIPVSADAIIDVDGAEHWGVIGTNGPELVFPPGGGQ